MMPEDDSSGTNIDDDYGLARPPTSASNLWRRIINLDPHPSTRSINDLANAAPPIVPLDKNATSMRVLLHDTQANFENFTVHMEKLISGINETKSEMKAGNSLFERDREVLLGDIVDLVNRTQRELQKAIGEPAQIDTINSSFKDLFHRMDGFAQRLDALQNLNQTHSQTLQTQIQAIQILLDKQGTIVAAVTPLLPLLQALPLLIDSVKGCLNESISRLTLRSPPNVQRQQALSLFSDKVLRKRKQMSRNREPTISSSPTISPSPSKKARLAKDSTNPRISSRKTQSPPSEKSIQPLMRVQSTHQTSIPEVLDAVGRNNTDVEPRLQSSPVDSTLLSLGRRQLSTLPKFTTPRRTVADLPVSKTPMPSITPKKLDISSLGMRRSSTKSTPFNTNGLPLAGLWGITPTAARPPRMLRMHNSISNNLNRAPSTASTSAEAGPSSTPRTIPLPQIRNVPLQFPSFPVSLAASSSHSLQIVAPASSVDSHRSTAGLAPVPVAIQTLPPPLKPLSLAGAFTPYIPAAEKLKSGSTLGFSTPDASRQTPILASTSKQVPLAVALGKMKERRSPVREGRRFIPLVDSEEDDDER